MKTFLSLIGLAIALAAPHVLAKDYVLLDTDKASQDWRITSEELGLKVDKPFSVSVRNLHGGRQEGVCIVEIDNGVMKISVVPTRGMNVLEAVVGKIRLGWDSPVSEVVKPAFIELNGRGGVGWLEGFNELVTRCGYEWVGHPGIDQGVMLPLHGLAANIPASKVVLSIDDEPPHKIRLRGQLKEQAFKKVNFLIETELITEPGAQSFTLHDTLINNADYPKEYEALYHTNFGPPLLDEGARFAAPVQQVSPFNDKAMAELPIGRPIEGLRATTTKPFTTSFPTGTNTAIPWPCCITQQATWELASPSIYSNYPSSPCGRTLIRWFRDMSRAWNPAPALPITEVISAH